MNLGRISGAAIVSTLSLSLLVPGACAPGPSSQKSDVEEAESCRVPRVLFVVDASASMTDTIAGATTTMTKWQALAGAVHEVLAEHGNGAQYGLMTFPGSASGCSTGEVLVDIGLRTRDTIDDEITRLVIPADAATPAGQTLVAASMHPTLLDPEYDNHVIFISDGWQYCAESTSGAPACGLPGDCEWMGQENCASCNACQVGASSAACAGVNADGCYCVRNWPVLGVEALADAGVKTYVVGFGDKVDAYTLNQAAVAGGNPLPDCDGESQTPSCFLQATSPRQLTDALDKIMMRLTTAPCAGACGIKGTRSCTLEGWTQCEAPKSVECTASGGCGKKGVQECVDGELSECSASCEGTSSSSGAGGEEGTSATSSSSSSTTSGSGSGGAGGAESTGGSGGEGGSTSEEDPWDDGGEDPWDDGGEDYEDVYEDEEPSSPSAPAPATEAEGGCSYGRAPAGSSWALLALLAAAWRRRRATR